MSSPDANNSPSTSKGGLFEVEVEARTSLLERALKSKEFNILMGVLTIYALVGDDIRLASYTVSEFNPICARSLAFCAAC